MARNSKSRNLAGTFGVIAAGGAMAALALVANRKAEEARMRRPHDDAPGRTARQARFGHYAVVGKTVTIDKPRAELFAFWRDFTNLSSFMENLEEVRPAENGATTWVIKGPMDRSIDVVTKVVEEEEGELIAWRSVEGSTIDTEGRVKFRDAPGGRGTHVELIVSYKPPAGEVGRLVAKLLRREPEVQARHDLKRFKMLMETGEIATSARTNKENA